MFCGAYFRWPTVAINDSCANQRHLVTPALALLFGSERRRQTWSVQNLLAWSCQPQKHALPLVRHPDIEMKKHNITFLVQRAGNKGALFAQSGVVGSYKVVCSYKVVGWLVGWSAYYGILLAFYINKMT